MSDETTRTFPHRAVERALDLLGIAYISEYSGFPPYQLDMYIPEWRIAIEYDGPYHSPKHDRERDAVLLAKYDVRAIVRITRKDSLRPQELATTLLERIEQIVGA